MRIAVFGAGSIGVRHARNLLSLGCDVVAFDRSEAALSALPIGVVAVHLTDAVGIATTDFDAVLVATPWDQHLAWSRMAITTGIPAFIEKPLGTLEEIPNWRELAVITSAPVQIGYQCRFHPSAIDMKSRGPAWRGEFECAVDMRSWPGKAYGPLLLEASHELDLALWLGFTAVPVVRENIADVYVQFHDFSLRVSDNSSYHRKWLVRRTGECESVEWSSPESLGDQMYVDELKHFLDCVRDGKQTVCPLSDGLRVLEVCKAVEEMARQTA